MLAVTQVAAGPLYVCTSADGAVSIDGGRAACTACQPARHEHRGCCKHESAKQCDSDAASPLPCDCRHEALSWESQQVRRSQPTPSGQLLVVRLLPVSVAMEMAGPSSVEARPAAESHEPLADLASVCLRC